MKNNYLNLVKQTLNELVDSSFETIYNQMLLEGKREDELKAQLSKLKFKSKYKNHKPNNKSNIDELSKNILLAYPTNQKKKKIYTNIKKLVY